MSEPIESLHVGQRVLALNPQISAAERRRWAEPDWHQWLKLSLSMPKEDGTLLQMELLRPETWLRQQMSALTKPIDQPSNSLDVASPNQWPDQFPSPSSLPLSPLRSIYHDLAAIGLAFESAGREVEAFLVDIDLPELAISGPAIIEGICNAPPISSGSGSVITATFCHTDARVLDLVIGSKEAAGQASDAEQRQTIGTTAEHPFWSADRQAYVAAQSLEIGERVQTFAGDTKRVLAKLPRPGPEPVYNLEVNAEHVYFVGQDGILVHNTCDPTESAVLKSIRRHSERLVAKKTAPSSPETEALVKAIRRALHRRDDRLAGTYFHSLNFRFARKAGLESEIESPVVTPPGSSRVFRKPDYNLGKDYYDLKPRKSTADHYDFSEQFFDVFETTSSIPIPLYYRLRL